MHSATDKLFRSLVITALFLFAGCGKEVESGGSGAGQQRYENPVSSDIEEALSKQQVSCEPGTACPNYIGLLNIVEKAGLRACTSFLVAKDIVATAASCLPSFLRLAGQDCSKDVHLYFRGINSKGDTRRFACQEVLVASDLKGSNPIFWRDDVVYLRFKGELLFRRNTNFSRKGFVENENVSTWHVSKIDETTSFIKRTSCKNIHSSYANPFANNVSSPNLLMGDCDLPREAVGAPIVDRSGNVKGVFSQSVSSKISDYLIKVGLITSPLEKLAHATSYACAPTIHDSQVLSEVECLKDMSEVAYDKEVTKILDPQEAYSSIVKNLEEELNQAGQFFNFKASLVGNGDARTLSFMPVCFKPFRNWLYSVDSTSTYNTNFSFPMVHIKKALDVYGKIEAKINRSDIILYNFQFSTRNIRRYSNSNVYFRSDLFNHSISRLTADCPQ